MQLKQYSFLPVVFIALWLLSACTTLQNLQQQDKKTKPALRKSSTPRFIKDVTLGNKGGNKINMDLGNTRQTISKQQLVEDTTQEDIVQTEAASGASNDVKKEVKTERVAKEVMLANYNPPPAQKTKGKKHKKKKQQDEDEEEANTPDTDKEPLVNVVPTHKADSLQNFISRGVRTAPSKIKVKDAISCQVKYSGILCSLPQALNNVALYQFIDDWYGVDYQMGGNDKNGIDCSAFVQQLYLDVFGFSMVRTAYEQYNNCTMTRDINKLKEGDLVFFKIHSKHITHVGVYLMNNYFVHASVSQGVVISNLSDPYWTRYFAGAGQILEDFAPMH